MSASTLAFFRQNFFMCLFESDARQTKNSHAWRRFDFFCIFCDFCRLTEKILQGCDRGIFLLNCSLSSVFWLYTYLWNCYLANFAGKMSCRREQMLSESTAAYTASQSQSSVRINLVVLPVKTSVLWKNVCQARWSVKHGLDEFRYDKVFKWVCQVIENKHSSLRHNVYVIIEGSGWFNLSTRWRMNCRQFA